MHVILHPAARVDDHDFHGASAQPVEIFAKYVDSTDAETLTKAFPNGTLYARGATLAKDGSNLTLWDRISPGDSALFFKDRLLVGSGDVVLKVRNASLAHDLRWEPDVHGLPYELIYVVENVVARDTPSSDILEGVIGYKPKSRFGLRILDGAKAERILEWLSEQSEISPSELIKVVDRLCTLEATDVERTVLSRKEQSHWRRFLFGRSKMGQCSACKAAVPVGLLVAAHIKPRHSCSREERLDRDNIIAMCLLGCDALFEHGFISVDDYGQIHADASATGALRIRLGALQSQRVLGWSPERKKYFAHHAGLGRGR